MPANFFGYGEVGNVRIEIFFDTGCQINFIDEKLMHRLELRTERMRSVTGHNNIFHFKVNRTATVRYSIGKFSAETRFVVAPIRYDMILGYHWLGDYHADVNFRCRTISFQSDGWLHRFRYPYGRVTSEVIQKPPRCLVAPELLSKAICTIANVGDEFFIVLFDAGYTAAKLDNEPQPLEWISVFSTSEGSKEAMVGRAKVKYSIGDFKEERTFYVTPTICQDMVLGVDWHEKYSPNIDFTARTLTFSVGNTSFHPACDLTDGDLRAFESTRRKQVPYLCADCIKLAQAADHDVRMRKPSLKALYLALVAACGRRIITSCSSNADSTQTSTVYSTVNDIKLQGLDPGTLIPAHEDGENEDSTKTALPPEVNHKPRSYSNKFIGWVKLGSVINDAAF